jgi:predicted O-methyltransferase YrrM
LNPRWRVYRYAPGGQETFAPHIDAGFPPSGLSKDGSTLIWDDSKAYAGTEIVSRLTLLIYLNDDFVGGETKFYQPGSAVMIAAVKPIAGSCLVFPQGVGPEAVDYARQHWPLHEGSPVISGNRPKYVIRSDVLFASTKEPLLLDDPLWKHDHVVRQAFLPANNGPFGAVFLNHVKSLYNPHMGVENIATLLYSLIRFTKKRRIVEIGAGYTSLWILQALHDNEEEMARIRLLNDEGKCKLLDTPWTVQEETPPPEEPALLLCIDNCKHQKETATGACAVAKSLGLDAYLKFVKGDAFDMGDILEEASIDILWCDFGVGSRMKEFLQKGAWASLRSGGLLLCHSTLTNQRTRNWLEAVRARQGEDLTGIPADEYVELSLLEPHKAYQNSVSIFQKRKRGDDVYAEPIFSEYA